MTLLKDNSYRAINTALLSLENDIKRKLQLFDTTTINAQLEEINKRIDEINAGEDEDISDNSAEINDLRTSIENINADLSNALDEISTLNENVEDLSTQLSNVFLAENFVEDFNTTIEPGVYYWSDSSQNRPANYGVLLVYRLASTSNWIYQTAYSTEGKIYFRQKINDGEWTSWRALAYEDITKTYTIPDVTTPTTRYIKLGTFPWNFSETVKAKLSGINFGDTIEFNVLGGNGGDASVNGWYTTNSGKTKDIRVVPTTPVTFSSNIEVWLRVEQYTTLTVRLTGNAVAAQYFNTNPQMNNTQTAPLNGKVTNFTIDRGFFGQNFEGTARSAKGWQVYALNDLKGFSNSNFYPVVIDTGFNFVDVEIYSESVGGHLPYNQNRIKFTISAAGWSDTPKSLFISEYNRYEDNEVTIGCIGYCNEDATKAVIWLRGGLNYTCYTMNCPSAPSVKTVDTALGNSIATVGTSYSGGTNTKISILFTPKSTMSRGIYSSTGMTTAGSLVIKDDKDVTLSSYGNEPLTIGTVTGNNLGIDSNEIQARNNGAATTLYLNNEGGKVVINNTNASNGGLQVGVNITAQGSSNVGLANFGKEPLSIGDAASKNLGIDGDDIQARNNGAASTLDLNYLGGTVRVNGYGNANGGLQVSGHLNIPVGAPTNPVRGDIWLVL